ncbi:MAG: hypothetical protein IKZ53_08325 [Selenomonadaceae bacterium]|nr:hypothetical protein [Selenomonadaceae bacterium]
MIKYIKFTTGDVSDGYRTVEVSIGTKNVSYKILRNGLLDVGKKKSQAVEVSDECFNEFDDLKIFSWEKDYTNGSDGNHWELIFKHGKKSYRGHGSGDYPENMERFLDWLDKLIPDMEFVNRRRLEKVTLNYYREENLIEKLTLDNRAKTLTLDKKISQHVYNFGADIANIFDAAQIFFDNLEIQAGNDSDSPKINIELVRHDGSIEDIKTSYNEICLPGLTKFIEVLQNNVDDLSAEIFSAGIVNVENPQGKFIFCKVQFKDSYKSYTYRAEDETLAVGDIVDVPVGKNNDVAQAKIVEIGYFDESEAPFPIDRIKLIIGKHIIDDWENY